MEDTIVIRRFRNQRARCFKIDEIEITMHDCAFRLMQKVVDVAIEYDAAFANAQVDEQAASNVLESCKVYVWGSNTSQQLAKGAEEKVIIPAESDTFSTVQQVRKFKFIYYDYIIYFNTIIYNCHRLKLGITVPS